MPLMKYARRYNHLMQWYVMLYVANNFTLIIIHNSVDHNKEKSCQNVENLMPYNSIEMRHTHMLNKPVFQCSKKNGLFDKLSVVLSCIGVNPIWMIFLVISYI